MHERAGDGSRLMCGIFGLADEPGEVSSVVKARPDAESRRKRRAHLAWAPSTAWIAEHDSRALSHEYATWALLTLEVFAWRQNR